jgi:hypothetical protein
MASTYEVVSVEKRACELDLKILLRLADANAVVLGEPLKQLDSLLEHWYTCGESDNAGFALPLLLAAFGSAVAMSALHSRHRLASRLALSLQ